MNTFVIALVLLAGTNVLGQNPYEYVDDALIQKVGQIVYEYDQQVAASRAAGGSNGVMGRSVNEVSGGYQMRQPERVSRANTFNNYNSNANRVNYTPQQQRVNYVPQQEQRMINYVPQQQEAIVIPAYRSQQQQYNQVQQQTYVQPQQVYQSNRNQRQFVAAPVTSTYQAPAPVARTYQAPAPVARTYQTPAPVARTYQAPAPVARTYQAPAPVARTYQAPAPVARSYQTPVARMSRMYQEPQVVQQQQPMKKSGFSAYTLSQPEAIPMVAEFHFSEALNARADNTGSYNNANAGSLKTDVNHNNQVQMENNKFRLA